MMFGTCTSCGHESTPYLPQLPPSLGNPLSLEEEIDAIRVEIKQLDELILQIQEYRAERIGRLRTLHWATIKMPPEVLSLIFQHYFPQPRFDTFRPIHDNFLLSWASHSKPPQPPLPPHSQVVVLGAVCRHWRQVAYSTPQLWRTAEIQVEKTSIKDKADLIRLYLKNVGDISLSLKLDPSLPLDLLSETELEPIFRAICEGTDKIKQLVSTLDFGRWTAELVSPRFKRLDELALVPSPQLREVDLFPASQESSQPNELRLKHLTRMLQGVTFRLPLDTPLIPSITILDLDQRDLRTCARLLLLCPNLIEYRVRASAGTLQSDLNSLPLIDRPVVFNHLKRFTVFCAFQQPFSDILPYLRLPALEELGLGATDRNQVEGLRYVLIFLNHLRESSSSWSTLDLNSLLSDSGNMINDVLHGIPPCVTVLSLFFEDIPSITSVLTSLRDVDSIQGVRMRGLMKVRFLYVYVYEAGSENPTVRSAHSEIIMRMLNERRQMLEMGRYALEVGLDCSANWLGLQREFSHKFIVMRAQIKLIDEITYD